MVAILLSVVSLFVFRFRSRSALELKLFALQHQLAVLRRQRPGRPQLSSLDRLLWVLLYRIWPQIIDAMVLVKPATVVEWHRKGFRFYWRWRSRRPGRPKISPDIRDLIRRQFSAAYHPNYLAARLRASGWSPQVPAVRAKERDEEVIRAWLEQDWPRIRKKSPAEACGHRLHR